MLYKEVLCVKSQLEKIATNLDVNIDVKTTLPTQEQCNAKTEKAVITKNEEPDKCKEKI